MFKRLVLAAAVAGFLGSFAATDAYAFACPAQMAAIDAMLAKKPNLSPDVLKQVTELRKKGEELHNAGQHGPSVKTLAEAAKLLKQ